ncbi:MAG: hypothetical protein KGL42_14050 [Betaproteobacteria bacterium]|nr:hypothetical protein [Betaproteobacteria bacterium]
MSYIGLAALLLALGFGLGWHAEQVHETAKDGNAQSAALTTLQTGVEKQLNSRQQQLEQQADQSSAWQAQTALLDRAATTIHVEIGNATFSPAPGASAAACADPVGSPEFELLYNEAARGDPASSGSTGTSAR